MGTAQPVTPAPATRTCHGIATPSTGKRISKAPPAGKLAAGADGNCLPNRRSQTCAEEPDGARMTNCEPGPTVVGGACVEAHDGGAAVVTAE